MWTNQWRSSSELKQIQEEKLRRLIHHAYRSVPYYRKLMDSAGVKPQDIQGTSGLKLIPTTSKKTLLALPKEEIVSEDFKNERLVTIQSSGSTGCPFSVLFTRQDSRLTWFSFLRAFTANGLNLWDKTLIYTGSFRIPSKKPWFEHLGILRRYYVAIEAEADARVEGILRFNPSVIQGTWGVLLALAKEVTGRSIKDIRTKLIFGYGDTIASSERKFIGDILGGRIVDIYGSGEAGIIAWECGHCPGYHINIDMVIIEFLKDGQDVSPGTAGEIVLTNLHSYAMPLIRYEQQDMGIRSDKKPLCGRGLPLMKSFEGRTDDFVILPTGKAVPPSFFIAVFTPLKDIFQWRVVQESAHKIKVLIVSSKVSSEKIRNIENALKEKLGAEVEITIELVDEIKKDPSGKRRAVVSKVK
ncbi:MAG TPA: phenylacetate--CoA ligase family protein [Candidatus Hypogeohydataceae bacterium YC41]